MIPLLLLKERFRFSAYPWLLRPRSHESSDHLIFFALPVSRPSNCKTSQAMILLFLFHDVRASFLLTRWLNESDWTSHSPARRRPRGSGRAADRTQLNASELKYFWTGVRWAESKRHTKRRSG